MIQRRRLLPLLALALLALAVLTCNRSTKGEPTLVPTKEPISATGAQSGTPAVSGSAGLPNPTGTATPTRTATATATRTPTATPTPPPIVLIRQGQAALHNGDSAGAQAVFEALPVQTLEAPEAVQTRLGLAQSLLEEEDYSGAIEALREFLQAHPEHPRGADASFWLAQALMGQGEYLAAAEAYRAYLDARDVIAPYVQLWIGDALTSAESYNEAVAAYEEALTTAPTLSLIFEIREKLGMALGYVGDYEAAVAQYDAILAAAEDANLKARVQYQAAQTLLVAGEREEAYARLRDVVTNYYKTAAAYNALIDLVNSGQPVDEYLRGLVDYYNAANDAAIAAFYRYIEADLVGHIGAPHYFAGLAYRDEANYAAAMLEFDKLIDTHPGDPYVDDSWLAKAWTQYLAGDPEAAVATYTAFVADNPYNGLAAEALWWAANIHFWDDRCEPAETLFTQLASDYPANEYAPDALYRAAFCRFRLGNYEEAESAWQRYADGYPAGELVAGAHFWRGRARLAAGETVSATVAFEEAVAAGPLDYYSQRALDYLADLDPARTPADSGASEPFAPRPIDLESLLPVQSELARVQPEGDTERAASDGWLAGWLGLSPTEALTVSQLSPVLAADTRLLRGEELWRLGRRAEAKTELEWLRQDTATEALSQYQLAIFFRDLGLYRSSILAANAAIRLSPAESPFDAPVFLGRLAYPAYYADLLLPEAEALGLDPLLVFSLIRQESLFEGFAASYAFAYGLMQIIPSTGESIARSLRWPEYDTSDLYRPYVSVKFGTWYLAQQRDTFDGLIYPALAAYNAGPGNARRWLDRTLAVCAGSNGSTDASAECPFDYDVFVELINLYETRLYIRQIYKHFSVYQHLYTRR
jgi:soluble lytic murein transglycosylase